MESRSPDADVSPTTSLAPSQTLDAATDCQSSSSGASKSLDDGPDNGAATTISSSGTADCQPHKSTISFEHKLPRPDRAHVSSRKLSVSSLALPSTLSPPSRADGSRIRASSPPHQRFQQHVGFDNVSHGEATKNNTLSITLNVKHKGFQSRRWSRTFMVGVVENANSDYAIQWLVDELVDDGDEIVCVHVVEKDIRYCDKAQMYEDANRVMDGILAKNGANRAISFVLEYAVGKLHETFQKLILLHQAAMLIVGARGRSLGGIQGLVNSRNSFSKYCLQYSPVPVVVVRPTEKRIKKKVKRGNDATRQTYVSMLAATGGIHEADSETSSTFEMETQNSPDEEAHQVAKVLGLPAKFDPTIKPLSPSLLRPHSRQNSPHPPASPAEPPPSADAPPRTPSGDSHDDEDEDEDDDGDFEAVDARLALAQQQKLELHEMEVGEAAALKQGVDDEDSDERSEGKSEVGSPSAADAAAADSAKADSATAAADDGKGPETAQSAS
ncbi:hypothetical protein XA68_10747 [Ophiocordyceps unilateralis]|uniref:UspA domain-containing protein n=1 Tax=Ophiocordyceps unilateralis TaxID=268505 RepID=A0A2A9PI65_OPHUN|nr:hypothetical protein XA68_10747 [Ophiocordyceps unilateralis]